MSLPKIDFMFEGKLVSIDANTYIKVEENLNTALHTIAERYYEVANYIAHFKHAKEEEDISYNAYWSRRYHELKASAYEQLYMKKPSEQALEYALAEDKTVQAHKRNLANFQKIIDQLYALANAVEMKMDVLKELGSHIRSDKRFKENQ
jgi:hypothetical protein